MASRRRDRVPPPEVKTWQACAALGGQQREGGMHVEREQREHLTCARISDQPRPQVASYRASAPVAARGFGSLLAAQLS